ncbi:MAG: hypothetical protein LBU57_10430, partial [Dysgonamonadaceae bacterium]|nr:hypothetical protein [Dysgonamonadaceae bacterium]
MNTTSLFVKQILTTIGICIILFLETSVGNAQLPNPEIKSGTARVSGKVLYYQEAVNISPTVFLIVFNPLTAEKGRTYETVLKKDGSFYFEVPVECNYTLGYFGLAMIGLAAGEETRLEVIPHATDPTINMTGSIKFVSYDALNINKVLQKVIYDSPRPPDSVFVKVKCPEDFVYNSMIRLDDKLMLVENETGLSEIAKRHIMREIKLVMLDGRFLKYQQLMHIDYLNSLPAEERDKAREHYVRPPEPGRSYYSFLKYFDLNDPQYLYCETYPLVLRTLLANETLNIPDIGDTPVDKWLKGVKAILSDLVGSDTGLFYEMLASIAYSKQFINGLRPLSDRQKENITRYFKNKEISKI